jgi:hypothetical protein
MKNHNPLTFILLAAALLFPSVMRATPYATSLTNNAGTISFRLNESADSVDVVYTNLSAVLVTNSLGALPAGLAVNALGVPGTFSVIVSKQGAPGYVSGAALQISTDTVTNGTSTNVMRFNSPRGVAVNQNPASPYFGRIYVANSDTGTAVRPVGDGIYLINADFTDAVGQGDTALTAGINTFTNGDTSGSTPWRLAVGQDNQLYISDYSFTNGTIYVTDPDVTTGTNILAGLGGPGAPTASVNHGRIGSKVIATGSLGGGDLVLYAIDTDTTTTSDGSGNFIMRWDVNSGPIPVDLAVTNVDNRTLLVNAGITMDMDRGPDGKFYTLQNRSDGLEGGIFVVDPTVDGSPFYPMPDGLWDEVYDSRADSVNTHGATNDLLRQVRGIKVSPDGKYLAAVRDASDTWIVPLTNGIPNLAERKLVVTGTANTGRDVNFDAAGNLYVATSGHSAVRVFSPGYQTIATTSSDGTFSVTNMVPETSVTLTGSITNAAEPSSNGEFTFTRTGSTASPLTVFYVISGTATRGADYNTNSIGAGTTNSITLDAGVASTNIPIIVINDASGEATETVNFTLLASSNYVSANNVTQTVFIDDDGDLPSLSVANIGSGSYELLAGRPAKFRLTMPVANGVDVTASISLSGTAVSGVDYSNPSSFSVTLLAGVTSTNFTVTPIDNSTIAADKTIIASIVTNIAYGIGTTNATNTLRNDDLPAAPILFSDGFDTDTSANWVVNASNGDSEALFAYDYSVMGIPSAPTTTNGTTLGLRFRANLSLTVVSGISASPIGVSASGDYRLRFDVWINYNGPFPAAGSGSTEYLIAGIGVSETRTNVTTTAALPGASVIVGADGDGGSAGDYNVYLNGALQTATSIYSAASRNNSATYYQEFGELPCPAIQKVNYPATQTDGLCPIGTLGFAWHDAMLTKVGTNYTWTIDGLTIASLGYSTATVGSNVSIGYQDLFSGLSANQDVSFAVFDNVRVESLSVATPLITSISLINSGTEVQVDFTAGTSDVVGDFVLQATSDLTTAFADVTATITSLGGGQFRAVRAVAGPEQFYRIKR